MEIGPNSFNKSVYVLCKKNNLFNQQYDIIGVYENYSSIATGFNTDYYIIGPVPFHSSGRFNVIEHKPFGDLDNFPGHMDIE